jgi:tetratricopeptide (TPR) repeat protein
MLTELRRRLGKLKDRLERRVETIAGGQRPGPPPMSGADEDFMLSWLTGKATDAALIERAKTAGEGGLALLERACAARPANALVCSARAELCLEEGDLEAAIFNAERGYALGPLEPGTGAVLVRILTSAGRPEEALRILPFALENARRTSAHPIRLELCGQWQAIEPDSVKPLLEEARTYTVAGEPETAIGKFEQLLSTFGPRAEILLPLGALYQDMLRPQDALRAYLQAVEAEPENVDALCLAGDCARGAGDAALADRCLSKAIELDPRSAFARFNLGLLRLDQGRIDEAASLVLGARAVNRGEPWTQSDTPARLATYAAPNAADSDWACARYKLVHDIEQFEYLRAGGKIGPEFEVVIAMYRAALADPNLPEGTGRMVALNPIVHQGIARTYKQPIHAPDVEPPRGPVVNPDLDWKAIEERYFDSKPNWVPVDGLLTPEALDAMRAFCLESTIWNGLEGDYLGAYLQDGFCSRLLLRIAAELRARMPRTLRDHALQTMWARKYDSTYAGIDLHGEDAAINVRFWPAPGEASLDADPGGLVVHTRAAPGNWSFKHVNHDRERIREYLESAGAKKITVPYRANRAVIFDSGLFHETGAFRFREGYENRRIDVTMLYGTRAG